MKTAAEDVLDLLDYAWNRLETRLAGLTDAEWRWRPSHSRRSFVLHVADELIHHGAEVDLLRDLYTPLRTTQSD